MSEVVLQRTFDIEEGKKILKERDLELDIVDSKYAFHINELGVNKAKGLNLALKLLNIEPKKLWQLATVKLTFLFLVSVD